MKPSMLRIRVEAAIAVLAGRAGNRYRVLA